MVTVGIDPHKHVHVAVAVDAAGRRIGQPLTVKNDGLVITNLLKWIRSITDDALITWAIEDGRGFARRLADGLLLAGHEVVWVPSRLTAAHRKLHAATGSKSDPTDAAAAAHAVIATPGLDRHRIDEHVRELRVLVDYRSDVVKRRTMVINQLKAQLHVWLDHTPGDLSRTKALTTLTERLETAPLGTHIRQALTEMIAEIADLNRRARDLDTTIKDLVSPLAPALLEITGISHISAAVLISEIGDITRFCSSAKTSPLHGLRADSGVLLRQRTLPPPPRREPPTQQRALHSCHRAEKVASRRARTTCSPRTRQRRPRRTTHPPTPPRRRRTPGNDRRPSIVAAPHHPVSTRRLT